MKEDIHRSVSSFCEPLAHKAIAFGVVGQIVVFQNGRCRSQIVVVYLFDGHAEVGHLVVGGV